MVALCWSIITIAQEQNEAQVEVINGMEVYIMNEPVRPYQVISDSKQKANWWGGLTGGTVNGSIHKKVDLFTRAVKEKITEEQKQGDAILYKGDKSVQIIAFTDKATPQTERRAKVKEINGVQVFIMAKPLADFQVVKQKRDGYKWKTKFTSGLVHYSIEEDVKRYTKRFKKWSNAHKINAIYYTNGRKASGIVFNNQ